MRMIKSRLCETGNRGGGHIDEKRWTGRGLAVIQIDGWKNRGLTPDQRTCKAKPGISPTGKAIDLYKAYQARFDDPQRR